MKHFRIIEGDLVEFDCPNEYPPLRIDLNDIQCIHPSVDMDSDYTEITDKDGMHVDVLADWCNLYDYLQKNGKLRCIICREQLSASQIKVCSQPCRDKQHEMVDEYNAKRKGTFYLPLEKV